MTGLFLTAIIAGLLVVHMAVAEKHAEETKKLIGALDREQRGRLKHQNLSANFAAIISSYGSEEMKKMMDEINNNFSN